MIRKILFIVSFIALYQMSGAQTIPRLDWATYHGGNLNDGLRDMVIDGAGNVYVIGISSSPNAIATAGSYQPVIAGSNDVYMAKYSNTGTKIWATYFGGGGDDIGQSIDLDTQGNIFITGLTLSTNGIANGAVHKTTYSGGGDIFVAKFSNNGNRIWGTYYGGGDFDFANDIEVDNTGNVIITGWTGSNTGIATPGSHQNVYSAQEDAFLTKFTTNGQLAWATYYGNTGFERGLQVESDGTGNIVISGWTSSTNNFTSAGAHQTAYGGATSDAFVGKFTSSGTRLWMTYYGGMIDEYSDALAVTQDGRIYVGGSSNSPNAIATSGSFQSALSGSFDAILAHFNPNGQRVWATYFGGSDHDTGYRIREGSDGALYMTGHTRSSDRISTPNAFQPTIAGGWDGFLAKFDITGNRIWSTYYGGSADEFSYGLVLDSKNDVFICGNTKGSTNLSTPGAAQTIFGGGTEDGFIAKFAPCPKDFAIIMSNNSPICVGKSLNLLASGGVSYTWAGPNGFSINNQNPVISNTSILNGGIFTVTVTDMNGCTDSISTLVTINPLPQVTSSTNNVVCAGKQINLTASGGNTYVWSGPNNFISNNQNPTINISNTLNGGIYTVTVTDTNSCSATSRVTVAVDQIPPISISSNSPVCAGSSLTLIAGGGNTYSWSGPAGFMSNQQNPVLPVTTIMNSGKYTVTVTGANFCTSLVDIIVVIRSVPVATASANSPVCERSQISFMSSAGVSHNWSGPNGFTSTSQNPVINNTSGINSGTYIVTITYTNNCNNSAVVAVSVNPVPVATVGSNSPVCAGKQINISASGGNSYVWSGPNNFSTTNQNIVISNGMSIHAGDYSVTVTDANICTSTSSVAVTISQPPLISFSYNNPVCAGSSLILAAGGGNAYIWSGPGGFTSNQQNPVVSSATIMNTGTYTVTVTGANACTASADVPIVIQPRPIASAQSNTPLCAGQQILLTSAAGTSYSWSGPDNFISINQNPVINNSSVINSGTYIVTITDANNCNNSAVVAVSVNPVPMATVGSNSPLCAGSQLILNTSGGNSYAWSGPNTYTNSSQNPLINNTMPINSGTYIVTVTGTNQCTSTASTNILITALPNIIVTSNSPVCTGDSIKFSASGGNIYNWIGPAGFNTNTQNPSIQNVTPANNGSYILTGTGALGCTAFKSISVAVTPKPIVSIIGADTICFGDALRLSTLSQGNLLWSNGQTGSSITVKPIVKTKYSLSSNLNGCSDITSVTVDVKTRPILTISPPVTIQNGENIKLNVAGADVYEWKPSESLTCTNCSSPTAGPSVTTTYCVIGTRNECTSESCVTIDVNQKCEIILPNIVTPNGDATNDIWCSPSKACITSQLIKIFDRWGNLLFHQEGVEVCWDVKADNPAIQNQVVTYILQLKTLAGKTEIKTGNILVSR